MKAVLAQIAPVLGDPDKNLGHHLTEIRRAARAGADLIVFPELSLTGYLLQDLVPECAQEVGRSALLRRLAAASRGIGVIAGFVERGPGAAYYNSAACFIAGKLVHLHRKVYLPTYGMFDEARYFAAGDTFRAFATPWGRFGILICEDFWHLSSSYLLAQDGMEVLVVISNSPTKGLDSASRPASQTTWLNLGQVVARFMSCFVLYANRCGFEDGWCYGGGSFAVGPGGKLIAQGKSLRKDSLAVTLDPERLRAARVAAPVLRDEKLDLVRRELERIAAARYTVE